MLVNKHLKNFSQIFDKVQRESMKNVRMMINENRKLDNGRMIINESKHNQEKHLKSKGSENDL